MATDAPTPAPRLRILLAAGSLLALAACGGAAEQESAPGAPHPAIAKLPSEPEARSARGGRPDVLPLPRATTLTARVVSRTVARAAPRPGGRPRLPLTKLTSWSRTPQRLMVTARRRGEDGREWVRVQLPVRPNGSSGWARADAVRMTGTKLRVVVRLGKRRLEVWSAGRRLVSWPAGVGGPGTPTPLGDFAVRDPVRTAPGWRGVYGGWTITLTAHSRVVRRTMGDGLIAIHGAGRGRTWRVGHASSYGCVILGEPQLAALAELVHPGTPVSIRA